MFQMTPFLSDLVASRRRQTASADHAFLKSRETDLRKALSLASTQLLGLTDQHAIIAGSIPYVSVSPERKTQVARGYYRDQPEVLRQFGNALSRANVRIALPPGTLGAPGRTVTAATAATSAAPTTPTGRLGAGSASAPTAASTADPTPTLCDIPPAQFADWGDLLDILARIREEAQTGVTLSLDLSLEMDAFAWYITRTVMAELVQFLDDDSIPEARKEPVRDGFKDFLAYKDLVLRWIADSKDQIAQAGKSIDAQLARAQNDEMLMQVQYATQHGQPVSQDLLEKAAAWWAQRKAELPDAGQKTPTATPAGDTRKAKR